MNPDEVEDNQRSEWSQDIIHQLENDLSTIEAILTKHLEALKTQLDTDIQEETFPEELSLPGNSLLCTTQRIIAILKRCTLAEDSIKNETNSLKKQIKDQGFLLEEVELERDVLLQQVHAYLETNSSLRVRLEEQRCQSGSLQKQANASLEQRIKLLENDKEKLSDSNLEKDKQLHKMAVMLEQTASCLKNKETEVLNWKNEENNLMTLLKADLKKALEEKTNMEEKYSNLKQRLENYFWNGNEEGILKNSRLKRSLSTSDIASMKLSFLEKNILLEPPREFFNERFSSRSLLKPTPKNEPNRPQVALPTQWRLHASRSWPSSQTVSDRPKSPPVHTQLNALRRDLVNVTRKLDALKSQLTSSGVIAEEENRSLKRKAKPMEEEDNDGISEGQKWEFKNLKHILQDAKNLNAKLANLREEKQRIIDMNRKEKEYPKIKEGVSFKKEEEEEEGESRGFRKAVQKLKEAVSECEERLEGGTISKEEAFVGLVPPVFSCLLSNLACYHEWRMRTGDGFKDETDVSLPSGEGRAKESTSPHEDGGGDTPLKNLISMDDPNCKELKSKLEKLKVEHLQNV